MTPCPIKTEQIREWSNQYRLVSPESISSMIASMQSGGQLQPVVLQKDEDGYKIIDGIKRYRAALELKLEVLNSYVFEVPMVMAKAMIIYYNLQGKSLSMYEQGLIVSSLVREHRMNQKEVSKLLRQSHSWVCRRLAIAERLLPEVQDAIRMGSLSVSHGRELVKLPRGNQAEALKIVLKEGLSCRECAVIVDRLLKTRSPKDAGYIYQNSREIIRQASQRDKYYDPRLSTEGNQLLKTKEMLMLQINIMNGILQSAQMEKLTADELSILLPVLPSLIQPMERLIQTLKTTTNER